MELEGDLGVETEGEVVVEDAEGQRVADVARAGRLVGRRLGVLLDEQLPPVQVHHLAVVHRRQYLRDRLPPRAPPPKIAANSKPNFDKNNI